MAPNTRATRGGRVRRLPSRSPAHSPARSLAAEDPIAAARVRQIEQQIRFEAEDREARRAREDAESAARIAAIAPQPAQIATPSDDLGELSRTPQAQLFFSLFPLVPQKQLVRVYKWPNADYNPSEIFKLLLDSAFDNIDDTYESIMMPTGKVYQKRAGKREDYGDTNAKWSAAFLLWTAIRVVHSKDIDLFLKLHRFHAKIVRLSETYTWDGVLKLAVHLHTVYYNDAEASWLIPDKERDARCIRKLTPTNRNPRLQTPHTATTLAAPQTSRSRSPQSNFVLAGIRAGAGNLARGDVSTINAARRDAPKSIAHTCSINRIWVGGWKGLSIVA
jgi:hypothetical protein